MAHGYLGTLLAGGPPADSTTTEAKLVLKNDFDNTLKSVDTNASMELDPSESPPVVRVNLGETFQNNGSNWEEPLELDVDIYPEGNDGSPGTIQLDFEVFSFTTSVTGGLGDGDTLTVSSAALEYESGTEEFPGVVALMQGTGASATDTRFTLKDGASEISDQSASVTNPLGVDYAGGSGAISLQSNLEFTNGSSTEWNVDGLLCEAKDESGVWQRIDDVSFTNVTVGANATLRFTDVTHTFSYS